MGGGAQKEPTVCVSAFVLVTRSSGRSRSPFRRRRRPSTLAVAHSFLTRQTMEPHRIFAMPFASVYPHYLQKAEKKGRTKAEVDEVICWLTGYSASALASQIERKASFEVFFREAPAIHPAAVKITGTICGVRLEAIEDPLMRNIRYLDKLVDELAKGRPMAKILRA